MNCVCRFCLEKFVTTSPSGCLRSLVIGSVVTELWTIWSQEEHHHCLFPRQGLSWPCPTLQEARTRNAGAGQGLGAGQGEHCSRHALLTFRFWKASCSIAPPQDNVRLASHPWGQIEYSHPSIGWCWWVFSPTPNCQLVWYVSYGSHYSQVWCATGNMIRDALCTEDKTQRGNQNWSQGAVWTEEARW